MTEVKIKFLDPRAQLPLKGTQGSAAYDIRSLEKTEIPPKTTMLLKTGLAFEIPEGTFLMVAPRSSLALKRFLLMPHSIGILDSDYRGELLIPLFNNHESLSSVIEAGERIAQALLMPCETIDFKIVENLSETERGKGGFGSTGKI